MRDWEERMKAAGAVLVGREGVIANEAPDEDALEQCRAPGTGAGLHLESAPSRAACILEKGIDELFF